MLCDRFTTDSSYKEFEQMRVSMEPLTYKYGVDVFFYGHVHAYERTAPMVGFAAVLKGSMITTLIHLMSTLHRVCVSSHSAHLGQLTSLCHQTISPLLV